MADVALWKEEVALAVEIIGVLIILLGALIATAHAMRQWRAAPFEVAYRDYRRNLGRAILLGLEFLVAADIIDTVALRPSLSEVGVLAGIVLIRTFLSFSLEVEISGRWPWRRDEARQSS